jgi:hypothetical protein
MAAQVKWARSRALRFSTSALLRGVPTMAWLTAANRAWNVPPTCARSRLRPCQQAGEVLGNPNYG